ncbi:MAG: hypothetical protein WBQ41_03520, partial [Solirubrobacterales bacterium]
LFNPATGSFTATSVMAVKRYGPAAAPLPDGRVLVAGGSDGANRVQSAELFSLAPPNKALKFAVNGRNLVITSEVPGKVDVTSDTKRTNAKKGKGKKRGKKKGKPKLHPLLNPSSGSGSGSADAITVPLNLTGTAKALLKRRSRIALSAKIVFTPRGDECLKRFFDFCYSSQFATTETQTLTIQGKKKHKKKHKKKGK